MKTITKLEISQQVAHLLSIQVIDAKRHVQAVIDAMTEALVAGNRVELRDFAVFTPHERAPRMARNPKNGVVAMASGRKTVKFKAGRLLKSKIPLEQKA